MILVSPPSEPLYIQIVEYETRIFIKWLPNPVGSHKSETYTVEYRRHKDTEWKTIQGITSTHIFVNDLVPNTLYFVQLYAVNQDGKSNRTAEYVVKTGILNDLLIDRSNVIVRCNYNIWHKRFRLRIIGNCRVSV